MRTAGVAELKAGLSGFLNSVKNGEVVVVTERGRPVAQLVPLEPGDPRTQRQRLIRAGLLQPGRGRVRRSILMKPPGGNSSDALAALLAERDESR